jgi:hypothetical protein
VDSRGLNRLRIGSGFLTMRSDCAAPADSRCARVHGRRVRPAKFRDRHLRHCRLARRPIDARRPARSPSHAPTGSPDRSTTHGPGLQPVRVSVDVALLRTPMDVRWLLISWSRTLPPFRVPAMGRSPASQIGSPPQRTSQSWRRNAAQRDLQSDRLAVPVSDESAAGPSRAPRKPLLRRSPPASAATTTGVP